MTVDELVARYKALRANVYALAARQEQAAEQDQPTIEAAMEGCYEGMEHAGQAILDMLLGTP